LIVLTLQNQTIQNSKSWQHPTKSKQSKSTLKNFEKAKRLQQQLAGLEAELKAFGLKLPKVKKERATTGEPVKRTPIDEAKVIEFFADKELGYLDVAANVGKSGQTVKKWLDSNKKFSRRNENPKNEKSKVLHKLKKT